MMKQACPSEEPIRSSLRLTYLQLCTRGVVPSFQFPAHILEAFSARSISIRIVAATGSNLSLAVEASEEELRAVCNELSTVADITIETDVAALSIPLSSSAEACSLARKLKDIPLLILTYHEGQAHVVVKLSDYAQAAARIAPASENL